jgi:hypothetical protein
MSTSERPTIFPPNESLSREVGEFVGSPSGLEISDGSGYHIASPPLVSGSNNEPLLEAFGEYVPDIPQRLLTQGLLSHCRLPPNP